jgi:hypothetical protein
MMLFWGIDGLGKFKKSMRRKSGGKSNWAMARFMACRVAGTMPSSSISPGGTLPTPTARAVDSMIGYR